MIAQIADAEAARKGAGAVRQGPAKPVGRSPAETAAIYQAARNKSIITAVGYNYRWPPVVRYARQLIQDGKLVPVLNEYEVAGYTAIWALFPSSRHISLKVRTFLDFFVAKFRHRPYDKPSFNASSSADCQASQEADSAEATAM